jgi:hypothetical protein
VCAKVNATTFGIIANKDVLAVGRSSCGNKQLRRDGNVTVWVAAGIGQYEKYMGLFNLGEGTAKVQVLLADEGIPGPPLPAPTKAGAYSAKDLWTGLEELVAGGVISRILEPHESALFLVHAV